VRVRAAISCLKIGTLSLVSRLSPSRTPGRLKGFA
jgi:hypothetical protein